MKVSLKTAIYLLSLCLVVISCDDSVTIKYDESAQGTLLERDLSISPEDNVKNYLASVDASYSDLKILNKDGAYCACTLMSGKCKCKLSNEKGVDGGCKDTDSKCTKDKVIQIDVNADDVSAFSSLEFK